MRYYRLMECFRSLTSVPLVRNTSFNENEPVVCSPKEALDRFLRIETNILGLGDFFIKRLEELPPRDADFRQPLCPLRDREPDRLQAVLAHDGAQMHGVLHRHDRAA